MASIVTPGGHGTGLTWGGPDIRDHLLTVHTRRAALPSKVSLRGEMPPIKDQLQLGSCTAFASTAAYQWQMLRQGMPYLDGSELAQYYWSRQLEGTTRYDAGATIRDSVKSLVKNGMAPEAAWPYDISKFAVRPAADVKTTAKTHQALEYQSVPVDIYTIKSLIAQQYPVLIGIVLYRSFESDDAARTGMVPMPTLGEDKIGGHGMLLTGYDDDIQRVESRGSWGDYGDDGYMWLPYSYVGSSQFGADYWIIKTVEAP